MEIDRQEDTIIVSTYHLTLSQEEVDVLFNLLYRGVTGPDVDYDRNLLPRGVVSRMSKVLEAAGARERYDWLVKGSVRYSTDEYDNGREDF